MDVSNLTISKARELLVKKEISAEELTCAYINRIGEDSTTDAYLEVYEDAVTRARKIDETGVTGALGGIPITNKDNILIEGKISSAGSKILESYRAPYTATAAQKLLDQGAIFLGRANMDEFAMGSSTEHSAFKLTRNPRDPERVPGGSSGGSAAAVAADQALAALGSDTGGSIRLPASFTGVVGLKPTYGSVSRSGLIAMGSSLDCIGPFTKTVIDAELIFDVMKGKDPLDATTHDQKKSMLKDTLSIGVPYALLESGIDKDVKENFMHALDTLKDKGYEIREIDLPSLRYSLACYYVIMFAEASSNLARMDGVKFGLRVEGGNMLEEYLKTRTEGFGAEVRRRILLGTYVLSAGYYDAYYGKALGARRMIRDDFETAFESVDCIAFPTSPVPAPKVGEKSDPLAMYAMDIFTVPMNLAGVPAISIPSGVVERDASPLPVGLELVSAWDREDILFKIGKQYLGEIS